MTTPVFYVPPQELCEGLLALRGPDHHHLSRVLRMRPGEKALIMDGEGRAGRAAVVAVGPSASTVKVEAISCVEKETPLFHLFQALPAGKKMEAAIQACVELGVDTVTPFASERSRPLRAASPEKVEKWRRVAREASRLARRPFLPLVAGPLAWGELLEEIAEKDAVLFADEAGGMRPSQALEKEAVTEVCLVVGPEGGFTPREREDLGSAGAVPVTLGGNVLRTEAAGLVLLAAVRCRCGLL